MLTSARGRPGTCRRLAAPRCARVGVALARVRARVTPAPPGRDAPRCPAHPYLHSPTDTLGCEPDRHGRYRRAGAVSAPAGRWDAVPAQDAACMTPVAVRGSRAAVGVYYLGELGVAVRGGHRGDQSLGTHAGMRAPSVASTAAPARSSPALVATSSTRPREGTTHTEQRNIVLLP